MKIKGIRGGMLFTLEATDTPEVIENIAEVNEEVFANKVSLELNQKIAWPIVEKIISIVKKLGGELLEIKPSSAPIRVSRETIVLERTIRSGTIIDSSGSIVILGDVNSGAELIAEDDIIVIGALRGLAHAGASGNEKATIWSKQILSPQLRIAEAVAQADGNPSDNEQAEVAYLYNGQIAIKPWK